jgi:PAS domain S-box-containing protein
VVDQAGTITSWNPAAEHLLGHPTADAVGQNLALISPAEHRPRRAAAFHQAIDTGMLVHDGRPARVEATHASGEKVQLVFTLGLLKDARGAAIGAVAVVRAAGEPISFVEAGDR